MTVSLGGYGNKHRTKYDFRQQFSQPAAGVTDAAPTGAPPRRRPAMETAEVAERLPLLAQKQGTLFRETGKGCTINREALARYKDYYVASCDDGWPICVPCGVDNERLRLCWRGVPPRSLQAPSIGQVPCAGEELLRRRRRSRLGNPHRPRSVAPLSRRREPAFSILWAATGHV